MSRRLTAAERQARVERRAGIREAAAAKVAELRTWREDRATAAKKRALERAVADRPARGVDRVPEHLRDLAAVEIRQHTYGKRPGADGRLVRIDSGLGVVRVRGKRVFGNHDERRRLGQRGKPRRLRRREMPGAEARRIERNRKAWSA